MKVDRDNGEPADTIRSHGVDVPRRGKEEEIEMEGKGFLMRGGWG